MPELWAPPESDGGVWAASATGASPLLPSPFASPLYVPPMRSLPYAALSLLLPFPPLLLRRVLWLA